jgi:hypothetical protein
MTYIPKDRVSIIEDDNLVIVDGMAVNMDLSSQLETDIWAIHWDVAAGKGEIEFNSQRNNAVITNINNYQSIVDIACQQIQSQLDEEAAHQDWLNSYPVMKSEKLNTLTSTAQNFIDSVVGIQYPDFEKLTFETQKSEALTWSADNSAPTPNVDVLALNRGVDRTVLLQKILIKTTQFEQISMAIAGQRQAYEDQIDATTTVEQLNGIAFNFTLPA